MQKESGNNTYNNKKLIRYLHLARVNYNIHNHIKYGEYLKLASRIIKILTNTIDILNTEIDALDIFDINLFGNNIDRVNNKLVACRTAIKEYNFFMTDKQGYLNDFIDSKIKDIRADSAFEKATKEIILYLGNEKRNCLMNENIYSFFHTRQNNIREITQEFKKARIAFLEKYIPQDKQINIQPER